MEERVPSFGGDAARGIRESKARFRERANSATPGHLPQRVPVRWVGGGKSFQTSGCPTELTRPKHAATVPAGRLLLEIVNKLVFQSSVQSQAMPLNH
jgi:hypothetical protein